VTAPRARHVVLVAAGTVLVGSGVVLIQAAPRADAPDIVAPVAASVRSPVAPDPQPVAPDPRPVPPEPQPAAVAEPAPPTAIVLPGTPGPAPLVPVGVLPSGALQLPDRPTVLGWYAAGAVPGDPSGTAVVAGHIDSARYGAGPLEGLLDLRAGDPIEVTDAAGSAHRYAVTSRASYPKSAGGVPPEVFRRDGPPQLALITCGGLFDERSGSYADNVVVLAAPVP
jgi:sortase family protein